jgi:hypothetical protein
MSATIPVVTRMIAEVILPFPQSDAMLAPQIVRERKWFVRKEQ